MRRRVCRLNLQNVHTASDQEGVNYSPSKGPKPVTPKLHCLTFDVKEMYLPASETPTRLYANKGSLQDTAPAPEVNTTLQLQRNP